MVTSPIVRPRFAWAPPAARSLGPDCVAFWRDAGGTLFGWQELVIDGVLGLGEDERWASGNDGLCVARQNGKGVILQAIEVFFAFELGFRVVMHTAHEFATSQVHQQRLEAFIQDCPHLHSRVKDRGGYMHANGQESINLRSGASIIFKARTKGGGRGYSGDLLVWDEAMIIPAAVVGAQKPMLRASRAPHGQKTIYAGSAVDQEIHEHGVPFALIRERGIAQTPRVSYHEWSAPFDHPSEMTREVLLDRSWWAAANPSIPEGLIAESYMEEEILGMPSRTSAVELACVGDWPSTEEGEGSVISARKWDGLADDASRPVGGIVFAIDASPSRSHASIGVAGRREDQDYHVELVDRREGTGWVVARAKELVDRHRPIAVVCDSVGPAASLVPELERAGVKVELMETREHVRACGTLFDAVEQGNVHHLAQPDLDSAVRGAATRPLGDAWAWKRKGRVDISPLVAVTLALGRLASTPAKAEPWAASW